MGQSGKDAALTLTVRWNMPRALCIGAPVERRPECLELLQERSTYLDPGQTLYVPKSSVVFQ